MSEHQPRTPSAISAMATSQHIAVMGQPLPLSDRVAVITGASRGIGKAIATHLRSLGPKIVINYTSSSIQADQVAAELNAAAGSSSSPTHPDVIAVKADVSDPEQVKALFDRAEEAFGSGSLRILVSCAGVMDPKYPTVAETEIEEFDKTFSVNARGTFLCCREAARRIRHGGGGRIITISSSLVGALFPGYSAYAASKAAVETMTKILAKELKGRGITANAVAPGPVATELFYEGKTEEKVRRIADMNPMGRLGEPEDIAGVVGFLASDAGEWVNGQVVRVNGGMVI